MSPRALTALVVLVVVRHGSCFGYERDGLSRKVRVGN